MSFGFGFGFPRNYVAALFTPAQLFTAGVNGAWYDPSDINLTWRRNLLTYSEQFDNVVWTKANATVTANAALAPDGNLTADKLVETTATAADHYTYNINFGALAGSYTYSIYAKAGERQYLQLAGVDNGVPFRPIFDLSNGTVVSFGGVSAFIQPVGSGWYRCGWTKAATALTQVTAILQATAVYQSYTGDGTSGIYIWGAQLERGSTATPYQRITDGIKDYLDYNPLPILYQDAAGTTPVTAVGQPVGLMLDKSKGLVLGSEKIVNGDGTSLTGWSNGNNWWTVSGGRFFHAASSAYNELSQTFTTTQGVKISFDYEVVSGVAEFFYVKNDNSVVVNALTGIKTFTSTLPAGIKNVGFNRSSGTTAAFYIDNISVRELSGNHAFNPSGNSANFPVLSARYNLLTKTEDFSDAVWNTQTGVVKTPNYGIAPDGAQTACRVTFDGAGEAFYSGSVSSITRTRGLWVKSNTASSYLVQFSSTDVGSVLVTPAWRYVAATTTAAAYDLHLTGIQAADILIWHPDTRVANDSLNQPAYQRVNTATDYDTVGFKPYLSFNGVNQWLQTNSIDFTYGDKMFVSAGVRKLSDAAASVPFELSVNGDSNTGTFQVNAPSGIGSNNIVWFSYGTTKVGASASGITSPVSTVMSGIGNISGPESTIRINGVQAAKSTLTQGTGNYGNYPLYIGARAGSSLWFNGRLYGLVVAGKQASTNEIASTESWLNKKTGAY